MTKLVLTIILASFILGSSALAAWPSVVPAVCSGAADIDKCNLSALEQGIVNVVTILLGVSGSLALAMFVYGGFCYILAGGEIVKVDRGKSAMKYAILGLVIALGAGMILRLVVQALGI
jgi:hypothetical protein